MFGRYVLERLLGKGGMGVVWKARDETLNEDVALKFLPDAVRWDPGAFADLKSETRRARQLTHPNIIRIHDFVEDAGGAAISMEWVDGRTLTEVRLERPHGWLEPEEISVWLPQLCAALDYAHTEAKVVHRDLKPSNVMLTRDGRIKVGDFGIARSLADSITRVSMMSAGTLVYMSPQQAMGEEPAPADDIYSLGATLYELLAGKPPFHTGDVRLQLFHRMPEAIAVRRRAAGVTDSSIPEAWERTAAACLAKEPAARPASAGEVAARVGGVIEIATPPSSCERRRVRSAAVVAGTIAVGFAAMVGWSRWPAGPPATAAWKSDERRALLAWNFDGDGFDGSGRGLDALGVKGAVPTNDRFGRVDRAIRLNGNVYIYTTESPALAWAAADPASVAVWVRLAGLRGEGSQIIGSHPGRTGDFVWNLTLTDVGRPRLTLTALQDERNMTVESTDVVRAGEWTHLAAVIDGRRARLYLDGKASGEMEIPRGLGGRRPAAASLRLGTSDPHLRRNFSGDLDDLRLWRRALAPQEVAALAGRDPPRRLIFSRSVYSERDDLSAGIVREFGPGAEVADWEDLQRWHTDDTRGWCRDQGFDVGVGSAMLRRAGARFLDEGRHFFITRFDGAKPDYFEAHDELGGMTLALGSWHSYQMRVLATLPPRPSRVEQLTRGESGGVARTFHEDERPEALAISWRGALERGGASTAAVLQLRAGRADLVAQCGPAEGENITVTMGAAGAPEVAQQIGAGWGDYHFTMVVAEGVVRFRAVSNASGRALFQEALRVPTLRASDVRRIEVAGVDAAELVIE